MTQMIPGLERRLMTSSEEEIVFIADLVSALYVGQHGLTLHRSRRALRARGQTTRRA